MKRRCLSARQVYKWAAASGERCGPACQVFELAVDPLQSPDTVVGPDRRSCTRWLVLFFCPFQVELQLLSHQFYSKVTGCGPLNIQKPSPVP